MLDAGDVAVSVVTFTLPSVSRRLSVFAGRLDCEPFMTTSSLTFILSSVSKKLEGRADTNLTLSSKYWKSQLFLIARVVLQIRGSYQKHLWSTY